MCIYVRDIVKITGEFEFFLYDIEGSCEGDSICQDVSGSEASAYWGSTEHRVRVDTGSLVDHTLYLNKNCSGVFLKFGYLNVCSYQIDIYRFGFSSV